MKTLIFIVSIFVATSALALKREIEIRKPNSLLPEINVIKENGLAVWTMHKSDRSDFVMLHRLNLHHANLLLKYSEQAQNYYKEIAEAGRCPSGKVSSGKFGKLQNGKDSDEATFEVVCDKNRLKLHIVMTDRFVIDYLVIRTEPKHLKLQAQRLIAELKKK